MQRQRVGRSVKRALQATAFGAAVLLLVGCASTSHYCGPDDARRGVVCYDGIRFARSSDPLYRAGVQDGCETGKGYFTKNYRHSASSENYRKGWIDGRSRCRPHGWSDREEKRSTVRRVERVGDAHLQRRRPATYTERTGRQNRRYDENLEVLNYD